VRRPDIPALAACLIVGLLLAPHLSPYSQYTAVTLVLYATVAQAYDVIGGYSGQLSLGVGAFLAVGGYVSGLLMLHTGTPWIPAVILATAASAAFAFLLGFALLRLRGVYFAVGTLAATVALGAAAQLWTWAGGGTGFVVEAAPTGAPLVQASVIAFVIATGLVLFIRDSAFGLRVVATRDNEQAAAGVGVSVFWHRMAALVISGALTGLAGALVALESITVAPGAMFSLQWTIYALLFVVVGGRSTVLGPIIGVVIVYYGLTQELQNLQSVSTVIEGVLLIALMRFAPAGLWPLAIRGLRKLRASPRFSGGVADSNGSRKVGSEPGTYDGVPIAAREEDQRCPRLKMATSGNDEQ
jgi:branched-chain amino acid transport system permease protein